MFNIWRLWELQSILLFFQLLLVFNQITLSVKSSSSDWLHELKFPPDGGKHLPSNQTYSSKRHKHFTVHHLRYKIKKLCRIVVNSCVSHSGCHVQIRLWALRRIRVSMFVRVWVDSRSITRFKKWTNIENLSFSTVSYPACVSPLSLITAALTGCRSEPHHKPSLSVLLCQEIWSCLQIRRCVSRPGPGFLLAQVKKRHLKNH